MNLSQRHNPRACSEREVRKNASLEAFIQEESLRMVDYSRFEEQPMSLSQHCYPYEKTPKEVICAACHAAGVGRHTRFLDVGCGKGFCLTVVAREFQPEYIAGVEINSEWAEVARRNLVQEGLMINVYTCDILNFESFAEYNCFYLFNPFDRETMVSFMDLLKQSMISHPRDVSVLYYNPLYHEVINAYANSFSYIEFRRDTHIHCVAIYQLSSIS